jgi:D-sedoheptulose 7-phosphate isomerase
MFLKSLNEHRALFSELDSLDDSVRAAGELMAWTLSGGKKIMFCGNGGSAADSQHLAAELTGRFFKDRRPLAAMALSVDSSALTCIANDYSFDEVFSRQVRAIGRPGDALVVISTSGNSANIIAAADAARQAGIRVVGLLGRDGGAVLRFCSASIIVPSCVTARIQEAHILIGHALCAIIEESLGY